MNRPITEAINQKIGHLSFHTPAHGGVIANMDVTELSYTDNLLSPSGVIAESQREASKVYGADGTVYITTGATNAIAVAIAAFRGSDFLIVGNAHKSVFNGARAYGRRAFYLFNSDEIQSALEKTRARCVIVTSPDYFGNCLNLEKISRACKAVNAVLIVDASHGSHFVFSDKLPISATEYGDLVIHSAHKTLPVLTGGAMLHYKKEFADRVLIALNSVHSTSPSYLIMASIEEAIARYATEGGKVYDMVISQVEDFTDEIKGSEFSVDKSDDKTRVVLSSRYDGGSVADYLESQGVYPECSIDRRVVLIVSENTAPNLKAVARALKAVPNDLPIYKEAPKIERKGLIRLKYPQGEVELVSPENAIGRVVAMPFGIYPPGVPSALFGEVITAEHIMEIKNNANNYFGLVNGLVCVVK